MILLTRERINIIKLSKCGKFETYLDKEWGYIAIKGIGDATYWFEFREWHDFVKAINDGTKNIGGDHNANHD